MPNIRINPNFLNEFEKGLNPQFPEQSQIPATVLGYGEISTVLEIKNKAGNNVAYKRMPMFHTEEEFEEYLILYKKYIKTLDNEIGIGLVPGAIEKVSFLDKGRIIGYIIQEKLNEKSICHKAIHYLDEENVKKLVRAVLIETKKVFDFNKRNSGKLEIGFDGQISNWAIVGFNSESPKLGDNFKLIYFDTSTPLLRENGMERLNPELFYEVPLRF